MNNIEHYLEVAKECGATENELTQDGDYNVCMNHKMLEAYTARILADKETDLAEEKFYSQRKYDECAQLNAQLSEAQALIAMQAEALKECLPKIQSDCYGFDSKNCIRIANRVASAISASAESVAAWEEAKLKPLQQQVAMLRVNIQNYLYPNNLSPAGNRMESTRLLMDSLNDTQATAEAHDAEVEKRVLQEVMAEWDSPYSGKTFIEWLKERMK